MISGSAGSGKSFIAEKLLTGSKKIYIAASKIDNNDNEMLERVKRHKLMREEQNFITIEKYNNLSEIAESCHNSSVLIESLTALTANEIFDGDNTNNSDSVITKIFDDIMSIKAISNNLILVSDNIFCDGVIYDGLTELYIKTLAELIKKFAHESDDTIECFAGLSFHYKNL
ncbi:MAG: bifunctional adenosylcobinamide kinase/adenosylcobinamide-phosphate guanylyltransferase [Synergistaceae bacterium]|nr:bifunctional adenosylcobinamide kinase/adenosylcobinamide-phosphate guanylyltransferase [Synergistaceae bacterium]